jgi:hypothetical protein
LASFYSRRIQALDNLKLFDVISRKNPYLFRANGVASATEMVRGLMSAHVSSSDEGIFAEEFFEPIVKAVSKQLATVIAAAKGADFVVETDDSYEVIALKSGPRIFNSSQSEKQGEQFQAIERSVRATLRGMRKQFVPIMGCCYGRADLQPSEKRPFFKLAGQAFWERVTGDPEFYLKLSRLMKDDPDRHKIAFAETWARAENRFVREFTERFCAADGKILWDLLVQYNSGRTKPKFEKPTAKRLS